MIVGFHFTKLLVELHQPIQGKINVRNDLTIKEVKEQPLTGVKISHKTVSFQFAFTVSYTPHIADILLVGDIYYAIEPKKADELLATWKSKRKVNADVSLEVLNYALQRCNIRALEMAQELSLPTHIPMPRVNLQQKTADAYIG